MKQELERLLLQKEEFLVEGALNKNKLAELARQYDSMLLNLLMSEPTISNHFFSTLEEGILVFKKDTFLQFLNNKEFLPDSFTAYKTKIGLSTRDNHYLSENNEVVLNFPYKDCVLEGGQTKDDAKRQEIFFNETLAPTEINRLLDDKVLTNFKRFDVDGEHEVTELSDTDNLIIKGNNLVALHSLKKRFAGKVKLIFIDPPYNTGSDSFGYNDNFNHSSWLTFIKNRLQVAKQLLAGNGSIWITLDDSESHYMKVLADEVFGRENFIVDITWEKSDSPKMDSKLFSSRSDHLLVYAKNKETVAINRLMVKEIPSHYNKVDEHGNPYYLKPLRAMGVDGYRELRPTMYFGITAPDGTVVYPKNADDSDGRWRWGETTVNKRKDILEFVKGSRGWSVYFRTYFDNATGIPPETIWKNDEVGTNRTSKKEAKDLLGSDAVGTPKPEKLIQRIIQIGSNEGDLVLDFFMGSATTQAVAHKMNRKYIGIEQMDYIETVSVERLKKVIAGEQGGISKDVNWQGGGSFVYAELKNDAQDFKNAIFYATTIEELLGLFELAKKSSFLSYRIDPKKLKASEFEKLSLAEQKQILSDIIDHNNLYVNYSDIDNQSYNISEQDKRLNRAFYGEE